MRLAFIHGINNEDQTAEKIEHLWWNAISAGWVDLGLPALPKPIIEVGYYGKMLADAVAGRTPNAIAQGGDSVSRAEGEALLQDYMSFYNITEKELGSELKKQGVIEQEVVPQGWIQGALVDTAGAIESILSNRGQWVASGFLKQATHYIEDKGLAAQINLTVRKQIFDEHDDDLLVVSHSLGTVVMYKMLGADNRVAGRRVPLFVTLGSPLGIGMMRKILPAHAAIPNPPIEDWVNAYRYDDFVPLDRPLDKTTIGLVGVENISSGLIELADKHSVVAYLQSPPVCSRIHTALRD